MTGRSSQPCSGKIAFGFGIAVDDRHLREGHGDHGGRTDNGAGRQVNAAGDDHLGHADGDDTDDGHLQDDDFQPLLVEDGIDVFACIEQEAVAEQKPAEDLERRRDDDERDENVHLGRPRPSRLVEGQIADAVGRLCHVASSTAWAHVGLHAGCLSGLNGAAAPPPAPLRLRTAAISGERRQPAAPLSVEERPQFFLRKSLILAGVTSWNGM